MAKTDERRIAMSYFSGRGQSEENYQKQINADGQEKDTPLSSNEREEVYVEDVELYRAYGNTKRVIPWIDAISTLLIRILTVIVLGLPLTIAAIIIVCLYLFTDELIVTCITVLIISVLLPILTRTLRKRMVFLSKLKKLSKKEGYELDKRRGFFKCFKWNDKDEADFVLYTDKYRYYVKYFTATKYHSQIHLFPNGKIVYKKLPLNNKFTVIFGFKAKAYHFTARFPSSIDKDPSNIKVILMNPVPMDAYKKSKNGGMEVTGTGEKEFGYILLNHSGFLETVKRNDGK